MDSRNTQGTTEIPTSDRTIDKRCKGIWQNANSRVEWTQWVGESLSPLVLPFLCPMQTNGRAARLITHGSLMNEWSESKCKKHHHYGIYRFFWIGTLLAVTDTRWSWCVLVLIFFVVFTMGSIKILLVYRLPTKGYLFLSFRRCVAPVRYLLVALRCLCIQYLYYHEGKEKMEHFRRCDTMRPRVYFTCFDDNTYTINLCNQFIRKILHG